MKKIGLDVGSTTVKCVIINESGEIIHSDYRRHFSQISSSAAEMLRDITDKFPGEKMALAITGSAGMGMATDLSIPFVQEVYATRAAVKGTYPETDAVIELGGEDAKILFLTDGLEV